jgi:hypothetical protein
MQPDVGLPELARKPMIEFLKNLPAALQIAGPLRFFLVVVSSIVAGFFVVIWISDTWETISYNRKKRRKWHANISYWKFLVFIFLVGVAFAILKPAYDQVPRLIDNISSDRR